MRHTTIKSLGINPQKGTGVYLKVVINEKIRSAIKKIKQDFDIPEVEEMTEKEIVHFMEDSKLIKRIDDLIKEFDLPKTWDDILIEYIVTDNFMHDVDPDGLSLETRYADGESDKKFYLRIFPHTSIKDIKDVWFLIQKEINPSGIKTKKKKHNKFKRDVEIFHLHNEGKTNNEILAIITKASKTEKKLDPGNIKVIISNMKKLVKGQK